MIQLPMGYSSNKPIREWENNVKSPDVKNLKKVSRSI